MALSAQPEKMDGASLNVSRAQREKLRELFPEIFTEGGKIDFERLRLTLGDAVDVDRERYGMNWPGKAACFQAIQQSSRGTLTPARGESVNFDATKNLIIEGDNLEVLKLLQKSYFGKVKMIYIDPPYNTGNDFIYPDNYSESMETYLRYTGQVDNEGRKFSTNSETEGRFHSKWLNMMYPRLFLARNLLREDGVIFISIDDAEVDNLRKICNEIFGEENFIVNAVLQRSTNGMGDKKGFARNHEYILSYQKSDNTIFRGLSPDSDYLASFSQEDEHGKYKIDGILMKKGAGSRRQDSPTLYFPLYYSPQTGEVSLTQKQGFIKKCPIKSDGSDGRWTWGRKKITNENYRLFASPNGTIYIKDYLTDDRRMKIKSILIDSNYITDKATNEIRELFDSKAFDTPKPIKLIKDLADICTNEGDLILDFFSGSATTAHAIMRLNADDGGQRKFILIQLPEPCAADSESAKAGYKTIADITKERVRRVIKKLQTEKFAQLDLTNAADGDLGFKVFKLQSSNFKAWNPAPPADIETLAEQLELHTQHLLKDRSPEDILYELLLKSGLPLALTVRVEKQTLAGKTVFSVADGDQVTMLCLEQSLSAELIKAIAGRKPTRVICLDTGFAGNDQLKTNAVQIMKSKGVEKFMTV
jgi:adenine-specific DNA-methyltransferase